jgi:hypothetical protein
MRSWLAALAVGFLVLTGCVGVWWTDIQGQVTPTSPKAANCLLQSPARVESLRPAFRWKPVALSDAQYDFIIFEAHETSVDPRWIKWIIGREVYYREGIPEPEYRLDDPLQPKAYYFWSVRVRRAGSVSEWSLVGCRSESIHLGGGSSGRFYFPFFIFKTPSE